jgi:hypothetical protein
MTGINEDEVVEKKIRGDGESLYNAEEDGERIAKLDVIQTY